MIKLSFFIKYFQTKIWALQTCPPKRQENQGCQSSGRGGASCWWPIQRTGSYYSSILGYQPDFLKFLSYHRTVDNKKLGREIELTITCCEAPGRWGGGRNNSSLRTQTKNTAWPRWSQWAGQEATARTRDSARQRLVRDPPCPFLTSEFYESHFRLKNSNFEIRNSQKISSRIFWKNNVINSLE